MDQSDEQSSSSFPSSAEPRSEPRRYWGSSPLQDRFIPQRDTRRWRAVNRLRMSSSSSSLLNAGGASGSDAHASGSSSGGSRNSQHQRTSSTSTIRPPGEDFGGAAGASAYHRLLQSELLDFDIDASSMQENHTGLDGSMTSNATSAGGQATQSNRVLRGMFTYSPLGPKELSARRRSNPYSLSPLSERSAALLKPLRKPTRLIAKSPYKVLDAPDLADDFYLNLIDWSSRNVLAVGLGPSVYLWSAETSTVQRLVDVSTEYGSGNTVTSVSWSEKANSLAVGTQKGTVELWDPEGEGRRTGNLCGHEQRVGAMAWNGDLLATGSRDRSIHLVDVRMASNSTSTLSARRIASTTRQLNHHKQEVCGLRWSTDHVHLASGGNDNKLLVWSPTNGDPSQPQQSYAEHQAAVKAIAWSPHHHGLLASGGGTADRTIRFWNTLTEQSLQSIDTGSQVCNLAWSKYASELVSTHGYSQNQILVWKYPSLGRVAELSGHTTRVLYLAVSPDGESIVTGAGDETLRFWKVFDKALPRSRRSALDLFTTLR